MVPWTASIDRPNSGALQPFAYFLIVDEAQFSEVFARVVLRPGFSNPKSKTNGLRTVRRPLADAVKSLWKR